jgi:hypothetical protein
MTAPGRLDSSPSPAKAGEEFTFSMRTVTVAATR